MWIFCSGTLSNKVTIIYYQINEFAKLRAICLRANVVYVSSCLHVSVVSMPMCLRVSVVYVPTCQKRHNFSFVHAIRRSNVSTWLANVPISQLDVPTCQKACQFSNHSPTIALIITWKKFSIILDIIVYYIYMYRK